MSIKEQPCRICNLVPRGQHSLKQAGQCDRIRQKKAIGVRLGGTQYSDKDRAYRAAVREQVKQGYINDSKGGWIKFDSGKAMHRDQRAGYKF